MKRSPKILCVGQLPPKDGGGALLTGLVLHGLADRGYAIHALAPVTPELVTKDRFGAHHPGIDVTWFKLPSFETNPRNPASGEIHAYRSRQISSALPKLIEVLEPDVILVGHHHYICNVPTLAKDLGLPCIVMVHGVIDPSLGGTYRRDLADEMLAECRKAALLIGVAQHVATGLRSLGFDAVEAVPNAIDSSLFCPGPQDTLLRCSLRLNDGDVIVLHPSSLKDVKRPLDVIASAERALHENARLCYLIVGEGPRRAEMETTCRAGGMAERFRFVGQVDYARMPDFYRLADMVLIPSESEGLALAYLEAMSAGCVLLASEIPAAQEVIHDGVTGLLFPVGDTDTLTERVLEVVANHELHRRVGQQARAWAEENLDIEKMVDAYSALIEHIVEQGP